MSWLSDLIKGEIAEQEAAKAAQPTAGEGDAEALKNMLRDLIREEVKTMVADEVKAAASVPEAPEATEAPKQPETPIDVKSEVKKALAETLNSIPAKTRSIEESYERVFGA